VNMFRAMADNGGDIEAGILAYAELVAVEREKLQRDAYEKLLVACNDDGAIILKLIKSLLEPLSMDIKKAFAGEEAGVGLHDIGNTKAEAWTALSVAKGYLEESHVTDAGESFLNIINGGEEQELWKKHHGCLSPIMQVIEYNIERHVKKFGPITEETVIRMIFFRQVFIIGKNDYTIKEYLKREEFILKIIHNDERHGTRHREDEEASYKLGRGPATEAPNPQYRRGRPGWWKRTRSVACRES
jgi:hypothetical protein